VTYRPTSASSSYCITALIGLLESRNKCAGQGKFEHAHCTLKET